ncbi:YrrS family protein [Salipaludibacillus sp. HK11]|uniref:YrrS family protein n=1 Tax=Salipaludibacillus sp. HK11 TaxID=3394320 RepID=UPI0039FC383C
MSRYGSNPPQRTDMRKKKKINSFYNISIGIVALLIVFIAGTLIIGGGSDDASTSEEAAENESTDSNLNESGDTGNSGDISIDSNNSVNDAEKDSVEIEKNQSNNENEENNENENEDTPETEDGEWEPIGTAQGEQFTMNFDSGTVNREEMDRALSYATGINHDDMVVWRVENGGNQTVIGTVSTSENANEPYQVIIEWVENEGWMPTSMEKLSSNPHR